MCSIGTGQSFLDLTSSGEVAQLVCPRSCPREPVIPWLFLMHGQRKQWSCCVDIHGYPGPVHWELPVKGQW